MLPQHLCAACESTVNTVYCKVNTFQKFDQKLIADLKATNPSHPYMKINEIVKVCCCSHVN